MNGILEFIKVNAKGIAGFVAGLIINAITAVINGQVPWPQTLAAWGQYLSTSLLAGIMVWVTGNKLTQGQIVKGAVQQGISVVTNSAIDTTAQAAQSAVHEATKNLPATAASAVNDVAKQVSDTVTNVLKGVADNFPGVDLKDFT